MAKEYSEALQDLYKAKRRFQPVFQKMVSEKWFETYTDPFGEYSGYFREIASYLRKMNESDKNSWKYFLDSCFFYSTFCTQLDEAIERKDKVLNTEIYKNYIRECDRAFRMAGLDFWDYTNFLIYGVMSEGCVNKSYQHYYIEDKRLIDILGAMPIKKLSDNIEYIQENAEPVLSPSRFDRDIDFSGLGICLHLPDEKNGISVFFHFQKESSQKMTLIFTGGKGNDYFVCEKKKPKVEPEWNIWAEELNSNECLLNLKIALNFLSYINCFKGRSDTQLSKHFPDTASKTPHLRSGHFRYLRSEHFTTKRNTWVFVKPSMVGTKAKTVRTNKGE